MRDGDTHTTPRLFRADHGITARNIGLSSISPLSVAAALSWPLSHVRLWSPSTSCGTQWNALSGTLPESGRLVSVPMSPSSIPKPPSSSPRASTRAHVSDHGRHTSLTPTRQIPKSDSPPPTVRIDLSRPKITGRDAGQNPTSWSPPWPLLGPLDEAGGFRSSAERSRSRDNMADSTGFSKTNSGPWSENDSDTSSEAYSSPPMAPLSRFLPVPPPQPLPPRGTTVFRPPPPWHAPVGLVSGYPRIPPPRELGATPSESDSDSEGSDAATRSLAPDGGRHQELRGEVETKRRWIQQLRHGMAQKRKELRELRRRKDDVDNAFMQLIRPHLTSKSRVAVVPIDLIGDRFHEMQSIRDEYYASESAYEVLELQLENGEFELKKLEVGLSQISWGWVDVGRPGHPTTLSRPVRSVGSADEKAEEDLPKNDAPAPPLPITLLGISGELPEDIHPLYQELLEAAGDRKLAEEYCEDLSMHHEKILYDLEIELHRKRVRGNQGNQISEADLRTLRSSLATIPTTAAEFEARIGIAISDDDLEFLRDYELVSKQAGNELAAAAQNLARLRTLCLQRNVMRKHASYHEQLAIFSGSPLWSPAPQDGNMTIDPPFPPPSTTAAASSAASQQQQQQQQSLAHPRFPILLSNPAHTLQLLSPLQALEQALRLPKDDPDSALRRAACMKELGIGMLMKRVDGVADYINQWLIHRLRTCPMEAELMLAVAEGVFRVVNLGRWQEEVLYFWRLDGAGKGVVEQLGPGTPLDYIGGLGRVCEAWVFLGMDRRKSSDIRASTA
ncbi:hypothetical protein BT67DRAFT_431144 [Trichocladium antarcticum]|uniref:Uncharacterized protein n=1 Tax=Trichocladium antarcticum TaxID=1450529 RepID=A0AAN6UTE1_9PEZI|nr:hypothetical protein BT67DRAFT_431144 [Trichocladium antarcticum]